MAEVLRYPYEILEDSTDYLKIGIIKYDPAGKDTGESVTVQAGRTSANDPNKTVLAPLTTTKVNAIREKGKLKIKKSEDFIFLPIPSNIQDGNSVDFASGSLDGLTASVLDYSLNTIKSASQVQSLDDFGKFLTKSLQNGVGVLANNDALQYFNRNIAAAAANIPFGGNLTASQLLARQTGNILNPNMELLFNGVNIRSFKFSFKMTPRNEKEAKEITQIIRKLKQNMSPSGAGSLYLETPKVFELTYMKGLGQHPYLHKFKTCALTDMSVNYTGEGVYATYADGSPISYVMDLGFKELEPIYADDYDSGDGLKGVGY